MNDASNQPPNPDHQRQREILAWASATLHELLPRPPDDTPQGRAVRDQAALTTFVTLEPVNYNEAEIALQHICLLAHAADSRRMADQYAADLRIAHKLCRQAESMERLARALLKDLLKIQTTRRKRQANPVTRAQDARTEQELLRAMTAALQLLPPGQKVPAPQVAAPQTAALPPRRPDPSNRLDLRGVIMSIWPEPSSTERSIGNRPIQ
jgi:hypothetical protein